MRHQKQSQWLVPKSYIVQVPSVPYDRLHFAINEMPWQGKSKLYVEDSSSHRRESTHEPEDHRNPNALCGLHDSPWCSKDSGA